MNILIVDYGMGNIKSIESTLKYCGVEQITIANDYPSFVTADKIILPGVGSFARAMQEIKNRNIDAYIQEMVIGKKKPILGICLGMQIMGDSSDEGGITDGLCLIKTKVRKFTSNDLKIPHVGFNQVSINRNLKLFDGFLSPHPDFYFTHSYRMVLDDAINPCPCNYIESFTAAFEIDNIAGVQFHPELSQTNGLKLLNNFIYNF